MRYGGDAGAVLGEVLQPRLELVQGSHPKQVHLGGGWLLQGVKHIAQGQTQGHVPEEHSA